MTGHTTTTPRLSLDTLAQSHAGAAQPAYDPRDVSTGIVHLGIGAFHRAHQAVYTDEIIGRGTDGWGICGVAQTRWTAVEQLRAQDGLFSVLTRGGQQDELRIVGSVREVIHAHEDADVVRQRLATPSIRVITVTVTEKGYRADLEGRTLDESDPVLRSDLEHPRPFQSLLGQLASGLAERRRTDAGPVTVVSCDNLGDNGRLLAGLVDQFLARASLPEAPAVRSWIQEHVAFPNTVVDRVVPATEPSDLAEVERRLGLADHGAVTAEPFRQWVIEDAFAAERPPWEEAGALVTADVAPYQQAKLRLLNGAHSLLAYLVGAERDTTVSDAVADDAIAEVLRRYLTEAAQTLTNAPSDLDGYGDAVLRRFANPAIRHRLRQIAADGSLKVPQRLVPVARDRVAAGQDPTWSALGVAAWVRYLHLSAREGRSVTDPASGRLLQIAGAGALTDVTSQLLAEVGVDEGLASEPAFRTAVNGWVADLERHGATAAVRTARGGDA